MHRFMEVSEYVGVVTIVVGKERVGEERRIIYRASLTFPCCRGMNESSMGKISSFVPCGAMISFLHREEREEGRILR